MQLRRKQNAVRCCAGVLTLALCSASSVRQASASELPPRALRTKAQATAPWARPVPSSPLVPSLRLEVSLQPETPSAPPSSSGASKSRYALPMFLSAVVPGAGEISMGHWWRGLPLVAVDVATWLGYAHYQSDGNDMIDAYEKFADDHWEENRWIDNRRAASMQNPSYAYWDTTDAPWYCNCSPPYITKEEDAREWYENAGKYEQFFPGWEDWENDPSYAEDPTKMRRIYADMRIEANETLNNADRLIGVAALTRVVSIVQSFWLVRRNSRSTGLMLEPVTFRGFGSGLRFKATF